MRIIVRTNQLMPKGTIRGGGGDGFHELTCHPEILELAVGLARQMAKRMAGSNFEGDASFRVESSELDKSLDGVEIVHE